MKIESTAKAEIRIPYENIPISISVDTNPWEIAKSEYVITVRATAASPWLAEKDVLNRLTELRDAIDKALSDH